MSLYKLEKESNISHATLSDLCNEKTNIENCSASLLYRIASALKMSMKKLYDILTYDNLDDFAYDREYDLFKNNICVELKNIGEDEFLKKYLTNNRIRELYSANQLPECMYLLSMVDYLLNKKDLPLLKDFSDIRGFRLNKIYVSESVYRLLEQKAVKYTDLYNDAIPVFLIHNIIEADINDVY